MMTNQVPVPVFILSGFLGSGKTTLLNHLLATSQNIGLRVAVLMNELGTLDVDGMLLTSQHGSLSMEKLIDGCICCSKKSEIPSSIEKLLKQQPDVLFIELTGVANPDEIVDALTEPVILHHIELKQIITVLDAEHVLEYNSIFESDAQLVRTLRRQLQSADLLMINKIELVSERTRSKIHKLLQKQNPMAKVIDSTFANFDHQTLFAGIQPRPCADEMPAASSTIKPMFPVVTRTLAAKDIDIRPSFSRLQTISIRLPEVIPLQQEEINAFIRRFNKHLIRAKGFMNLNHSKTPVMMQFAGNHIVWQSTRYDGDPFMVLIGFDLDTDAVTHAWSQLIPAPATRSDA
jgi:G3E family GTPase